jgi:hypothetical protein
LDSFNIRPAYKSRSPLPQFLVLSGAIRFDNKSLWSRIENRVDVWFADVCADRKQNENLIPRAKEAVLHRMRNLLATTIRESLGTK